MSEIINRVAESGIVTIDLDDHFPKGERAVIDVADQLWQGIALKEKDFRAWIKENDWDQYRDAHVAVFCSVDAIIPSWAYMLISAALTNIAATVVFGNREQLEVRLWQDALAAIDPSEFQDARVVIKGCGEHDSPPSVFIDLVQKLQPVARTIMYGEPCSTVPVWKRPRK